MGETQLGRRVMIAVDEGEQSMYALQWALDYLVVPGDSTGSPVGCDHIIVMRSEAPALSKVALTGQAVAFTGHVQEILERNGNLNTQAVLSRAKSICEKRNVKVESKAVIGEARYAICEAANGLGIDLLVVGSHGHGAVRRAIEGTVSDYCARHAKCPVVVVKRQDH